VAKTIVVTGSNSYLGGKITQFLRRETELRVVALASPRAPTPSKPDEDANFRRLRCDLLEDLPAVVKSEIAGASIILHLAWIRGTDETSIIEKNKAIIGNLMRLATRPVQFCFASSVSGSPNARSIYGRAKYAATQQVVDLGGVALVLGLVVDQEPQGPFKMLTAAISRLPLRLYFSNGGPRVYPVLVQDVVRLVAALPDMSIEPGAYRCFWQGSMRLNEMLRLIEADKPGFRFPFYVPTDLFIGIAAAAKYLSPKFAPMADKILGFLYKDTSYPDTLWDMTDMEFAPFEGLGKTSAQR